MGPVFGSIFIHSYVGTKALYTAAWYQYELIFHYTYYFEFGGKGDYGVNHKVKLACAFYSKSPHGKTLGAEKHG